MSVPALLGQGLYERRKVNFYMTEDKEPKFTIVGEGDESVLISVTSSQINGIGPTPFELRDNHLRLVIELNGTNLKVIQVDIEMEHFRKVRDALIVICPEKTDLPLMIQQLPMCLYSRFGKSLRLTSFLILVIYLMTNFSYSSTFLYHNHVHPQIENYHYLMDIVDLPIEEFQSVDHSCISNSDGYFSILFYITRIANVVFGIIFDVAYSWTQLTLPGYQLLNYLFCETFDLIASLYDELVELLPFITICKSWIWVSEPVVGLNPLLSYCSVKAIGDLLSVIYYIIPYVIGMDKDRMILIISCIMLVLMSIFYNVYMIGITFIAFYILTKITTRNVSRLR
eukprot:NODE_3753_length_1295_cov_73.457338_g3285_i0.p1 GENE.NODE_3753_length_1295_cov_73.457338_g3285_i0~~NODE_3753_length_1295_cov_73.457338_g3285_i0.p1  ORF type:complete len:340 (-),score=8.95 NODE_3753_length_1295_cov_73.457338_g3285_i0:217-1236(-)